MRMCRTKMDAGCPADKSHDHVKKPACRGIVSLKWVTWQGIKSRKADTFAAGKQWMWIVFYTVAGVSGQSHGMTQSSPGMKKREIA